MATFIERANPARAGILLGQFILHVSILLAYSG
jgi:hypothetical protein